MNNKPLPLEELKKLRKPIRNSNIEHRRHLSRLERVAIWITDHVGTMGFFLIIFGWTALWLSWNMFAPKHLRFDPFPSFVFWLFISNMIQIFLMPLIMIGQNLQSHHADVRAETDLKINELAELENETILIHLENQNEIMLQILKHIESNTNSKVSKES